ncbi:MAG TPA: hypothetical protein VFV94_15995 [Polyangiaceae bacterium]|nr:hypothetical protein [Polyangiaceae bacterium]
MLRGRLERSNFRRFAGVALTALTLLATRAAHAEEGRFSDRFFRGTSPGELRTAKVAVVGALYVAAVASVSIGVASLIQAGQKGDDADSFKREQSQGFCNDLASPACASYRNLLDEQREARNTGWILVGSGGLLALGGALTAELWKNDARARVAVRVSPGGLSLGLTGNF